MSTAFAKPFDQAWCATKHDFESVDSGSDLLPETPPMQPNDIGTKNAAVPRPGDGADADRRHRNDDPDAGDRLANDDWRRLEASMRWLPIESDASRLPPSLAPDRMPPLPARSGVLRGAAKVLLASAVAAPVAYYFAVHTTPAPSAVQFATIDAHAVAPPPQVVARPAIRGIETDIVAAPLR